MISRVIGSLLSGIFPQICLSCNSRSEEPVRGGACIECWGRTRLFRGEEILCTKCGAYFGDAKYSRSVTCPHCREHHYDAAYSLGVYEYALRASVIQLKTTPLIRRGLASELSKYLEKNGVRSRGFDLVVPVPLSERRRIERGFNQASIIARSVGKILSLDVDEHSLVRTRHTNVHRAGMDKRSREQSVQVAFRVARPRLIAARSILLVDDVFTSGATASACAEVLKKAGSGKVDIFTLARAHVELNG